MAQPGYAFVLPWSPDEGGGVTHVVVALLHECSADEVFCPILLEMNWAFVWPEEKEWHGIRHIRLRLSSPYSGTRLRTPISFLLNLPGELYRLRRLIRAYGLRVINVHFPGLGSFSLALMRYLRLYTGRLILTFHGSDVRHLLRSRGLERILWRLMLRGTDLLVFVSEDLRQEFMAFDSHLESRTAVIHNGIDLHAFTAEHRERTPLPAFIEEANELILSVGQFEHRKGHDVLLEAFELVLREHRNARLAIVGRSGPTLESTRRLIARRGLGKDVALITDLPHSQIPALLNRADVFVLSSRWQKGEFGEGFPLVLAEAGAFARPVVSTKSTGCAEIISDGVTGRLVPLEDPPALAHALTNMLDDRDSAGKMGRRLQDIVRERFSWHRAWQEYRSISSR